MVPYSSWREAMLHRLARVECHWRWWLHFQNFSVFGRQFGLVVEARGYTGLMPRFFVQDGLYDEREENGKKSVVTLPTVLRMRSLSRVTIPAPL